MKIKAKNEKIFGAKLIVPVDGLIEIGNDGCIEVSDECGELLCSITNDWESEETKKETEEEKEEREQKEAKEKLKTEKANVIKGIKEMTIEQMSSLASEAGYPESEWSTFVEKDKPNLFVAYLIKKYNNSFK